MPAMVPTKMESSDHACSVTPAGMGKRNRIASPSAMEAAAGTNLIGVSEGFSAAAAATTACFDADSAVLDVGTPPWSFCCRFAARLSRVCACGVVSPFAARCVVSVRGGGVVVERGASRARDAVVARACFGARDGSLHVAASIERERYEREQEDGEKREREIIKDTYNLI